MSETRPASHLDHNFCCCSFYWITSRTRWTVLIRRPCFEYFRLNLFGITTYGKQLRNFNEYAIKYFCAYSSCFYLPIACTRKTAPNVGIDANYEYLSFGFFQFFFLSSSSLAAAHFTDLLFPRFCQFFRLPSSLNGDWMRLLRALKSFAAIWSDFHNNFTSTTTHTLALALTLTYDLRGLFCLDMTRHGS